MDIKRLNLLEKIDESLKLCNSSKFKKLQSCLNSEKKFLLKKQSYSKGDLNSTNCQYLFGVLSCALNFRDVTDVFKSFKIERNDKLSSQQSKRDQNFIKREIMKVDIIFENGSKWAKVITKNSKRLNDQTNVYCTKENRSLSYQIKRLINLSKQYPHQFEPPKLLLVFFHKVPQSILEEVKKFNVDVMFREETIKKVYLENQKFDQINQNEFGNNLFQQEDVDSLNPTVLGNKSEKICARENLKNLEELDKHDIENIESSILLMKNLCHIKGCICKEYIEKIIESGEIQYRNVKTINLDVTTMMALTSNVCHGGCDFAFREVFLREQALQEAINPVLFKIFRLLYGKKIISCRTANDDFKKIFEVVGGKNEIKRGKKLLENLKTSEDVVSEKTNKLIDSHVNNKKTKVIFGFGDVMKAMTTSSKSRFINSTNQAGVYFVSFLHPPRVLTEQKELPPK